MPSMLPDLMKPAARDTTTTGEEEDPLDVSSSDVAGDNVDSTPVAPSRLDNQHLLRVLHEGEQVEKYPLFVLTNTKYLK